MLPTRDELLAVVDDAIAVSGARPRLLDFTASPPKPLIVVPDLHARRSFFLNMLDFVPPLANGDECVLSLLLRGVVRVVCLGDLFHSEYRGYERWLRAYDEYLAGNYVGEAITAEMVENLALLQMVCLLQTACPQDFIFLKGNHENIMNRTGGGDFAFRKFTAEGAQVLAFMQERYDDATLHVISEWERHLPLCAVFPTCAVSHAEPLRAFTRRELLQGGDEVVHALTWTRNDEAEAGSVGRTLQNLVGRARAQEAVWLSGHRPVAERYALRQAGRLVQLHNPQCEQIALVSPDRAFNPETDIVEIAEV